MGIIPSFPPGAGVEEGTSMTRAFELPEDLGIPQVPQAGQSFEQAWKEFRYVVASVDENALRLWSEIWQEFQGGVTPAGAMTPETSEGFKPSCGWPEFLEKFWLLRHYLEYILRFSRGADSNQPSPHTQHEENS
jgi:hypothetical protein